MYDHEQDSENVVLIEVQAQGVKVCDAGVSDSGVVFLPGDLHPLGSFAALMQAAKANVPFISNSAVSTLYPADWLRGECLQNTDRLRIIGNMEALVRSGQ